MSPFNIGGGGGGLLPIYHSDYEEALLASAHVIGATALNCVDVSANFRDTEYVVVAEYNRDYTMGITSYPIESIDVAANIINIPAPGLTEAYGANAYVIQSPLVAVPAQTATLTLDIGGYRRIQIDSELWSLFSNDRSLVAGAPRSKFEFYPITGIIKYESGGANIDVSRLEDGVSTMLVNETAGDSFGTGVKLEFNVDDNTINLSYKDALTGGGSPTRTYDFMLAELIVLAG